MKLYLVRQDINNGYDTYDGAVVAAETEEDARCVKGFDVETWVTEEQKHLLEVTYLGEAKEGTERGVILESFNAG